MSSKSEYTKRDLINQSLVAFGQGTGFMRVSRMSCREFIRIFSPLIDSHRMASEWHKTAFQVLERVRTVGRVAALLALEEGRTYIDRKDIEPAMIRVRLASKTDFCSEPGLP